MSDFFCCCGFFFDIWLTLNRLSHLFNYDSNTPFNNRVIHTRFDRNDLISCSCVLFYYLFRNDNLIVFYQRFSCSTCCAGINWKRVKKYWRAKRCLLTISMTFNVRIIQWKEWRNACAICICIFQVYIKRYPLNSPQNFASSRNQFVKASIS